MAELRRPDSARPRVTASTDAGGLALPTALSAVEMFLKSVSVRELEEVTPWL